MAPDNTTSKNHKPRLTVVTGPAGSGKTQWCLDNYAESRGTALLFVPSEPYAERMRDRLRQMDPELTQSGVMTFGKMLKDAAKCAPLNQVHRTCQRLALAGLVEAEVAPDSYFGRVRQMPGFVDALGDCLRELKLSGVAPDLLAATLKAAETVLEDPSFGRKAVEIAALYAAYQRFLSAHELCDEEDLPARTAERISSGADESRDWSAIPTVMLDGFYRLSRSWRDVLAAIAAAGPQVVVTLPFEESRPLLFATPARTFLSFEAGFEVTRTHLMPRPVAGPTALAHLERRLFRPSTEDDRPIDDKDAVIRIFDAPNPYSEVEMVVRALRKEHETHGTEYNRCAIIVRSTAEYGDLIRTVGESLGVPIAVAQGRLLADHPYIKTLLALCAVVLAEWRRDDVIGFLKSSYTPCDKVAADSLRLRASRRGLRQGLDGWRRLADEARAGNEPLAGILSVMLESDRRLAGGPQTPNRFEEALTSGIEDLHLQFRQDDDARAAHEQWKQTVAQVAVAAGLGGGGLASFAEFHKNLAAAVRAVPFSPKTDEKAVPVIEPYDAGQLDAAFVAVIGLTERVFPRRINEDPFFRDEERDALRGSGPVDLERQSDRADDERMLFYMAVTAARERLVLTFPRSAEESDTLPSFYLDEVRSLFTHVPTEVRTLADVAPRPEECVTPRDRLLAACANIADGAPGPDPESARIIESRHRPRLPDLSALLKEVHAAPRRYSITEIESYNRCPFQHLMRYGLKVHAHGDGAGAADKGTLLHAVMRRAMRKRRETSPEDAADPARLESALTTELADCMRGRAIDASAYRKNMMERALKDTLREMARREVRYSGLFGATPAYFELAFGQEPGSETDDEDIKPDDERDYDPASTPEPLTLSSVDGGSPIHLCGAIDRVDLMPDGRRAIVLDYKLGNSVEWDRIKQGKSLQIPLYMMAVEQLWSRTAAAGCYESPRDRGRRRFYRKSEVDVRAFQPIAGIEDGKMAKPLSGDDYAEATAAAQRAVRQAVADLQSGRVMATPGEHCRWCEYADVCRMGRDKVHDGEPYSDDGPSVEHGRQGN